MIKRIFDIVFSALGLVFLAPLFAIVAIIIKIDSRGPVFFCQERMGKDFIPFRIYKFRTMTENAEREGSAITVGGDRRITGTGKFLRKYKIDEFPQLLNVLKGDMSFVGPRPEVEEYVELYRSEYRKLLRVRPGITDPASLRYSNEEEVLASSQAWEEDYKKNILPAKINLSMQYVENHDLFMDLKLISRTVLKTSLFR